VSSADPERQGDGALPVRFGPATLSAARRDLAEQLAQGLPCRADRETMLAALRDIARLAGRWRAGNATGHGACAEVYAAIRGEAAEIPRWAGPGPAPPWYPQDGQATDHCGQV